MGYYDVASSADSKLDSTFAADLEDIYDKIRAVELALLGEYKTTSWGSWGTPASAGYPHCKINHSVLGNDRNFRDAIDYIRSQMGVSAFSWDLVKTDFKRSPAIPETLEEMLFALGRVESWETGHFNFTMSSVGTYISSNHIDIVGQTAKNAAADGNYTRQWNISTVVTSDTTNDISETDSADAVELKKARYWTKSITGAETISYLSIETANPSKIQTMEIETAEIQLTLPTPTIGDVLDVDDKINGYYETYDYPIPLNITPVYYAGPGTGPTPSLDDRSYTDEAGLTGEWVSDSSPPTTINAILNNGTAGTDGTYVWWQPDISILQDALDAVTFDAETVYPDVRQHIIDEIDAEDVGDSGHDHNRATGRCSCSYGADYDGSVNFGSFLSTGGTNVSWIYWSEKP